jgi:hypothetical protein
MRERVASARVMVAVASAITVTIVITNRILFPSNKPYRTEIDARKGNVTRLSTFFQEMKQR